MYRFARLLLLLSTVSLLASCGQSTPTWSSSSGAPADSVAPSRPGSLVANPMGSTGASLSWSASTDNTGVVSYVINRDSVQVATSATTSYADSGLSPATTYSYTVAAMDEAGNRSANSPSAAVTTAAVPPPPDTAPPSQPAAFTAAASGATAVNLSWSASTDNVGVTGYIVTRNGVQVATPGGTSYSDAGLAASTTYAYTVVARDAAGNRSTAASASATTAAPPDTTPPSQPANFAAAAAGPTSVNLSWNASTDNIGVTGYIVTRNGTQIGTPTGTSLSDTGLAPSTGYTYTVVARDAAGNRSTAASATATTAVAPSTNLLLQWDPVTAPNLTGYRVYYGTASRNYQQPYGQGLTSPTNTFTITVTGVTRFFFAVTTTDSQGQESGFSNEAFVDVP